VSQSSDETAGVLADEIDEGGMGPAALAAVLSVGLALYYYYVRSDKQRGQFIGLWPSTILALAAYFKLDQIKQLLQEADD
jgi:hypothetical protein